MFSRYSKMSITAKAAVWFTICSIIQKGISFLTVPIFTRIMDSSDYGTFNIYNSWLQILTVCTSLYLYYGVFSNAMIKFENDREKFISSMQGLTISITLLYFMIYAMFYNTFDKLLGLSSTLIVLMFFQMLLNPAIFFWLGKNRFDYKYKLVVFVTILQSVLNPILGIGFVWLFKDDVFGRVLSLVTTEILICLPILIYQFIKGKHFFVLEYWKYGLKLAIPLLPHYLSTILLSQGDRIIISKLVNNSSVAIYSIAYSIGMIAQIFTSSIINSYTPTFYKNIKNSKYKENKDSINILLVVVTIAIAFMMLFAPELIKIFGTSEYSSAIYVIPPVAASVFFIFLYNIVAIPQFYFEKTSFLMISSIVAALLNIILNYIFIGIFGYIAAGYTTLFCYIFYSLGHYIISSNILKKKNASNMYDKKILLSLSVLIIIFSLLCNYLYNFIWIRYLIILTIFLVGFIFKNKYMKVIKKILTKS